MLGKLLKYEFRDTSKLMLVTYVALIIATLMGSLSFYQLTTNDLWATSKIAETVYVILFAIYIFALIGIYIGDFIFLCHRYYKTMYSTEGYLTHTLPVSPISVLSAKMLTAFVWMILSSILTVVSVFVMISIGTGENLLHVLWNLDWHSITKDFEEIGMSMGFFVSIALLELLVGILYYILFVYASMAIGQLFNTSKIGYSILAGFCIYLLQQLSGTITLAITGYNGLFRAATQNGDVSGFGHTLHSVMIISLLFTIMISALLYVVCVYINKKKLNLE